MCCMIPTPLTSPPGLCKRQVINLIMKLQLSSFNNYIFIIIIILETRSLGLLLRNLGIYHNHDKIFYLFKEIIPKPAQKLDGD